MCSIHNKNNIFRKYKSSYEIETEGAVYINSHLDKKKISILKRSHINAVRSSRRGPGPRPATMPQTSGAWRWSCVPHVSPRLLPTDTMAWGRTRVAANRTRTRVRRRQLSQRSSGGPAVGNARVVARGPSCDMWAR
jgi:hypothetical protein